MLDNKQNTEKTTEQGGQVDAFVSCDSHTFTEQFLKISKRKTLNQIALMTWVYGNRQWEKGYNQGKYDPDFNNE